MGARPPRDATRGPRAIEAKQELARRSNNSWVSADGATSRYDAAVRLAWILVVAACHRGAAPLPPDPAAPTCTEIAEHTRLLIGPERPRARKIRDVIAARCDADGWTGEVRTCFVATTSLRKPQHCKAMLTADQRAALDHALDALAVRASPKRIPQICNEYQALIDRLGTCPAIPQQAQAALAQAYRELLQGWARTAAPDAAALGAQCSSLVTVLRNAVAPPCGW